MIFQYSTRQRWFLQGLVLLMPLFTLLSFHMGITDWLQGEQLAAGLWWGLCGLFVILSALGISWARFIRVVIEVNEEGLHLQFAARRLTYAWSDLSHYCDNTLVQLLRIHDTKGRLVLPVDHLMTDFEQFKQQLDTYMPSTLNASASKS